MKKHYISVINPDEREAFFSSLHSACKACGITYGRKILSHFEETNYDYNENGYSISRIQRIQGDNIVEIVKGGQKYYTKWSLYDEVKEELTFRAVPFNPEKF